MHAELLLLSRKTPSFLSARGLKKLVSSREHPIAQFQIIRMILVRQAQRWQPPRILQIGVKREAVVLDRQRCSMAENLHSAVEILCQRGLEVLSPARRSGRQPAESKRYWREIEACVKSASAVEANFLWIEFVEIVQHPAHRVTLVVV